MKRFHWLLLGCFYLLLATLFLWSVPIGEAPDEPGHLQCIEQVVTHGRIPIVAPPPSGQWFERSTLLSGRMCYHMPLYYLVTGGVLRLFSQDKLTEQIPSNNPEYIYDTNRPMFIHNNRVLSAEILFLRLFSIALGALFIWATVQIALALLPEQPAIALMAGILIAGWPQFLFMYRTISNDQLATTLAVVGLLMVIRRRLSIAACLFCIAITAKLTTLFALGVLGVAVLYSAWHERRQVRPIRLLLIVTTLLAPLLLHPTTRSHLLQAFGQFRSANQIGLGYWQDVIVTSISSGYARFGWMDIAAPQWQAILFWAVVLSLAFLGVWQWYQSAPHNRYQRIVLFFWVAGVLVSYWQINSNRFQPQFRFAFALLPVIAFYFACGFNCLLSMSIAKIQRRTVNPFPVPIQSIASILLAAMLLLLNVYIVTQVILPVY